VLAFAGVQIAAPQDRVDVAEPEPAIGFRRQLHHISFGIERIGRRSKHFWCFLKERVPIVPRAQVALPELETLCEVTVEVGLHGLEWLTSGLIDFAEGLQKTIRIELVQQ